MNNQHHTPDQDRSTLPDDEKSPDDTIDEGYSQINDLLEKELLEKFPLLDPAFFEKLGINVLERLGYGKGVHTGRSGDQGIDGKIVQDSLGFNILCLQTKRYANNVGSEDIDKFLGALTKTKTHNGVFITSSDFNTHARDAAKTSEKNIILINGKDLAKHMIENNIGIKIKKTISIKEIDEYYFEEGYEQSTSSN